MTETGGLVDRTRELLRQAYVLGVGRVASLGHSPDSIWAREWDVLVVLDACRYDMFADAVDDYDYLGSLDTFVSRASTTIEWLEKSFGTDAGVSLDRVAYVTGNPNSVRIAPYTFPPTCPQCTSDVSPTYQERYHLGELSCEDCGARIEGDRSHPFDILDEVWRYAWDNDEGTIEPGPITDRAIATWRDQSPDRMVVHYMQPHHPFVPNPLDEGTYIADGDVERRLRSKTVWDRFRDGDVDRSDVEAAYWANLDYILTELSLLFENLDANEVIITSDHGNAMGEYGIYGHHRNVPIEPLVVVPWCSVDAHDSGKYDPSLTRDTEDDVDIQDRLEALGYVQ